MANGTAGRNYYISVAGVMGSGKTTLTNLLAKELGFHFFEEAVNENPYLSSYYQDPKSWAFKSQFFYLQEKISQLKKVQELLKNKSVAQDTPIYQDCFSYAQAQKVLGYMNDKEYRQYLQFFHDHINDLPVADLIIQLDAPLAVLESRIKKRARDFEKVIDRNYLRLLCDLQNQWIEDRESLRIIKVPTDDQKYDILRNVSYRQEIIQKIKSALWRRTSGV